MIIYFAFQDMNIKVDRPECVSYKDRNIGTRCYERLKNFKQKDDWTREMDALIKKHNIKFEEATVEEMKKALKSTNQIIFRT